MLFLKLYGISPSLPFILLIMVLFCLHFLIQTFQSDESVILEHDMIGTVKNENPSQSGLKDETDEIAAGSANSFPSSADDSSSNENEVSYVLLVSPQTSGTETSDGKSVVLEKSLSSDWISSSSGSGDGFSEEKL